MSDAELKAHADHADLLAARQIEQLALRCARKVRELCTDAAETHAGKRYVDVDLLLAALAPLPHRTPVTHDGQHSDCFDCQTATCPECKQGKRCYGPPCVNARRDA